MIPTFGERLTAVLVQILDGLDDLMDASTIDYVADRAKHFARETGVVSLGMWDGKWGPSDDRQKRLQRELLELWRPWRQQVELLFSDDTKQVQRTVRDAATQLERWIGREGHPIALPPTMDEAKDRARKAAQPLLSALKRVGQPSGLLLVVPDTNVLIRSPDLTKYGAVLGTEAYTVILVVGVLREIDSHKVNHRNPAVREKARKFSDRLKGWRNQGSLSKGVKVQGDIFVRTEAAEPDFKKTLASLDPTIDDDRIIATVLELQRRHPGDRVLLLTGDTVMLTKADAASIPTADTPDPDPEVPAQGS